MKQLIKMLAVFAFVVHGGAVSAGSIQYSATNVGGPLWAGSSASHLQPFYVSADGLYSMEAIAGNFDTYFWLYEGVPVIPGQETPFLARNDDKSSPIPSALVELSLISDVQLFIDTQYTLLTRGFGGTVGTFTAEIRGVGDITLGQVPVPATVALFGLGMVGLGLSKRKSV